MYEDEMWTVKILKLLSTVAPTHKTWMLVKWHHITKKDREKKKDGKKEIERERERQECQQPKLYLIKSTPKLIQN